MIQLIFQALVSNKAHPEYGAATIPFPIPGSDYDRTIELLEELAIGSPTDQDCQVDGITGSYPILYRLMSQSINVDELDYRYEKDFTGKDRVRYSNDVAFDYCRALEEHRSVSRSSICQTSGQRKPMG